MTGRPSLYNEEIADEICDWLANGNSLRTYCMTEGKPAYPTVMRWLESRESFRENYARARQDQAHNDADRMNSITAKLEAGEIAPDVARVMGDLLKWTAGKRLPKVYGDKVHLGTDDNSPIVVSWSNGSKV